MLRETAAAALRDIARAKCAGVDPAFCVAARHALEDCIRMYQHKLKGLPGFEAGFRRKRQADYMTQYVFRVDAIAAVARAYASLVREGKVQV